MELFDSTMKRIYMLTLCLMLSFVTNAQDKTRNLDMKTYIDSVYVFGVDLTESRSAKGGIWNTRTGKPETPLNYTKVRKDTLDSMPVVKLYRQVVPGNHPLNGWETWRRKDGMWICMDGKTPENQL